MQAFNVEETKKGIEELLKMEPDSVITVISKHEKLEDGTYKVKSAVYINGYTSDSLIAAFANLATQTAREMYQRGFSDGLREANGNKIHIAQKIPGRVL